MLKGKVVDLSSDGWGVVKEDSGRVTFVPGTWIGDEIEFEIISEGKFRLGKLQSWIHKSSAHRPSPCKHWGLGENQCRACEWINIDYQEQLKAKEDKLSQTLKYFHISVENRHPVKSGPEFKYRNRIKLTQSNGQIGFQIPMTNNLAEISSCIVAEDWINEKLSTLLKNPPHQKDIWIQRAGDAEFLQGNTLMNEAMKESLFSIIDGKEKNTLELFCGEGNFSETLNKGAKSLKAYESSQEAIDKFKIKLPLAEAATLNLYSKSALKTLSKHKDTQRLFLDPPRSGYKDLNSLCAELKSLEEIIYVSCNPTTFCRDISILKGWSLKELYSFDLFPQTPHLEVMGKLHRSA